MRTQGRPDCFEAVNGPEDGALFPVARVPFQVGSDPCCDISLRLDKDVWELHAHLSAAGDGYRVRSYDGAPVYVDGKRVGRLLSRVVRAGGVLQVGNTRLCLECAPDGLATNASNSIIDSDPVWILRQSARLFGRVGWFSGRMGFRLIGRVLSNWIGLIAAGTLLYFCWPKVAPYLYGTVSRLVQSIMGSFTHQ